LGAKAEMVGTAIEAFNRRDFAAMVDWAGDDYEWEVAEQHPTPGVRRGTDEVVAYLRDWADTVADGRLEVDRLEERDDRVLATLRFTGGGGVDVGVWTITFFADDRPMRTVEFLEEPEAREAFGA
jgi:ketosteroid isomerase-like protein